MRESDFLSDQELEEATYGSVSMDTPQSQTQWPSVHKDYSQLPDFREKTLFTWVAPERIFNPRLSSSYKKNMGLLLVLIVLLLLFLSRMALLIVVLALIFLGFVLVNVPPRRIRHTITNYGIYSGDRFYPWLERGQRFWYEVSQGQEQVIIEMKNFPYRIVLLVGHPRNKKQLDKVLRHYLIQQRPQPGRLDEWAAWWQKNFGVESDPENLVDKKQ